MIGHSLGAAGSLDAAACVKTIMEGTIHPTINQENPDPDCDLDYVPNILGRPVLKSPSQTLLVLVARMRAWYFASMLSKQMTGDS
ncbi:MAG: hypothetical protein Ct9H300mP11_09560 [Chloroflexota bacterium]|nr:MAG: hypothetical protein Ct9H300mP11_09560 [Chloroflexota bacterium]